MRLKDKVAVLVGAGRGIGRAVALDMAREGAKLVIVDPGGSREGQPDAERPAEAVAAECRALGAQAVARNDDVVDFAAAGSVINDTVRDLGRVDILVNTAGVLRERMIWNLSEEDWDIVQAVHLKTCFNLAHHVSKVMRGQRDGRIILLTSSAWLSTVGQSNYGAAKGGIWSFTRALSRELGRFGVTVNAISPTAATRMTMDDKVKAGFKRRLDMGLITQARYEGLMNMGGPEFTAPLITWLASDAAANVNGQTFRVVQGRIAVYQEPIERANILKTADNGLFSQEDLDVGMERLMDGIPNPAPRQAEE